MIKRHIGKFPRFVYICVLSLTLSLSLTEQFFVHTKKNKVKPFVMMKKKTFCFILQNLGDTSIDSGRYTMATLTTSTSSKMTNNLKPRPFQAFPLESNIAEDAERIFQSKKQSSEENEVANIFNQRVPTSSAISRHPPSPPVRLRDR